MKPAPIPPKPSAHPHYFLGSAYQAGGHWYYPAESYALVTTGVASIDASGPGLTANDELRDPGAMTAAMQTVQLPAIAQVTNLENGRQILVRVNDRGPASPSRIIALSPRAALLLAMPATGAARVRVELQVEPSHAVVDQLGGGPRLAIATAPSGTISAESLPAGGGAAGPKRTIGGAASEAPVLAVPDRLPEAIRSVYADPGELFLECGNFGRADYARRIAGRLSGLGADVVRSHDGRQSNFAVRVGPFRTIPEADSALATALANGVVDAHITIE